MHAADKKRHFCLTGFMGSGKSTIGKKLAMHLNMPFIDTDHLIEDASGMKVKEIFAARGESVFRKMEAEQITKELNRSAARVISLGGGALIANENRQCVKDYALLIYIYSRPEYIYDRIKHSTKRPLFRADHEELDEQQSLERINSLMEQRSDGYNLADVIFDRDPFAADEAAQRLFDLLGRTYPQMMSGPK
jgi:shikimate kinase